MEGEIVTDLQGAERLHQMWDELAIRSARPYGAPGWQLGWWDAAAPADARIVLLAAHDAQGPAGVLALWAQRTRSGVERLRIMAGPLAQGAGPVVAAGRESEVARCFAALLAARRPRPATLEFEGVLEGRRWARLLGEGWPGRSAPTWHFDKEVAAPLVTFPPAPASVDDWLATRSSGFRQQLRRSRRGLAALGAVFSRAQSPEELEDAIPELLRLHHARWDPRGGSAAVDGGTQAALVHAARRLGGPDGRMTIERIDLDGRAISAHLFVRAGAETTYWLGGFDDAHSKLRPGLVALLTATEHALGQGVSRLDLGPGRRAYKERFADAERVLDWGHLLLPGPQRPFTRLQLAPGRAVRAARAARARR